MTQSEIKHIRDVPHSIKKFKEIKPLPYAKKLPPDMKKMEPIQPKPKPKVK